MKFCSYKDCADESIRSLWIELGDLKLEVRLCRFHVDKSSEMWIDLYMNGNKELTRDWFKPVTK